MAFTTSIFTDAGLGVLSQATATARVVIVDVVACEGAVSENDIKTQPKAYFDGQRSPHISASVVSVGTDVNSSENSRIVIALKLWNATADVTVKTILVTARVVSHGSTTEEVTFFGCTDADGVVIPYNADTPISVNVAMSFAFNRASSIEVAGNISNYLLADEVGRFVTSHAIGDQEAGDVQTIYGEKTFVSDRTVITAEDAGGQLELYYNKDEYCGCVRAGADNELEFASGVRIMTDGANAFVFNDPDGYLYAQIGTDGTSPYFEMGTGGKVLCDELVATKAEVEEITYDDPIILSANLIPPSNGISIGSENINQRFSFYGRHSEFTEIYASQATFDSLQMDGDALFDSEVTFTDLTQFTNTSLVDFYGSVNKNDSPVVSIADLFPSFASGVPTALPGNILLIAYTGLQSTQYPGTSLEFRPGSSYTLRACAMGFFLSAGNVQGAPDTDMRVYGKFRLLSIATANGSRAYDRVALVVKQSELT